MKNVKTIHIRDQFTVKCINKIAAIEERAPHDSATRLFREAAKRKLSRLKKK